ncbi:MAG: hypothetical protein Q7S60_05750 [bacterium]|nr:hypothetical protein [bacterium]
MAGYDNKYGIKENGKTQIFHLSRRMFCIKDNKLYIADANLPYSHAVWFEKEGWITPANDSLMSDITRGFIDSSGNIHFYVGYDFRVTDEAFKNIMDHLHELTKTLNLDKNGKVYGGQVRNEEESFSPIKSFGTINDLLVQNSS